MAADRLTSKKLPKRLVLAAFGLGLAGGMSAPGLACDLDGLPGMGGFHRVNPFATALQRGADLPAPVAPSGSGADQNAASDNASERRALSAKNGALRAQKSDAAKPSSKKPRAPMPKREWERDYGNGPISAEDKAIFT